MRPCLGCGDISVTSWCSSCRPPQRHRVRGTARQRGYTSSWDQLSKRARRMQPFCSDCGTREDLTVDHLPEAWARHAAGKVIRLQDVAVVCGPCNSARGSSRPGSARQADTPTTWGDNPLARRPDPSVKAQNALHTGVMCHTDRVLPPESAVQALSGHPGGIE